MKTIQKIFSSLGTLNTITVYVNENESEKVKNILDEVEQYVNELDDKFSVFKDTSEISNINKNAGINTVTVSKDTYEILKLSKEYGDLTRGTFDITLKPYIDIIKNKNKDKIKNFNIYSININYNDIILDEKNNL